MVKVNWLLSLLTSLLVSAITCLLMPLSMYDSNPSEFPMTAYSEVLFYSAVLAILVAVVVFLLLLTVGRWFQKLFLPAVGLLLGLSVALYAQGNLIGADYGALDGHVIQWELMRSTAVVNTLVWIACVSIPVLMAFFVRKVAVKCFRIVVPIVLAYVLLLSIMLFVSNISAFDRKKLAGFTFDKFMELSSERNLVVIILDSFDRAVFDRLLSDDHSWRNRFKGFTYYHNTVSAYCYTVLALPQIVSGYGKPENGLSIWQYQRKAYGEAPFLKTAQKLGFVVDAYYDENVCPLEEEFDGFGHFGNSVDNTPRFVSSDNLGHYASLYFCSVFRYLPHLMKKWWCEHQDEFKEQFYFDGSSMYSTKVELALSRKLKKEPFALVPERKVKFYHCSSIHVPRFNLKTAKEDLEMVCRFFDRAREAGVYDKTDFFIMADHGSVNRPRPLFMCSNGTDEFKISEMPFSYRHLCEAFTDSLNGRIIQPVAASPDEMIPMIDDPHRVALDVVVDEKLFDGIGTEFVGNGLELLATTVGMDVAAVGDVVKMIWNGNAAIVGLPIEAELQGKELAVTLTFDKAFSSGLKLAVQYSDAPPQKVDSVIVPGEGSTEIAVTLPCAPKNIDMRLVKLHLDKWEGLVLPPSIVNVKIKCLE